MSSPGYHRPHDEAKTRPDLRNAYSVLDLNSTGDGDSINGESPKPDPARPLSMAKSLPSLQHVNHGNSIKRNWGSPVTEADHEPGQSAIETEAPATQVIVKQEEESEGQLMTSKEAVQAIADLPRNFDAQLMYSTNACIFVANLPHAVDDLTLQSAITKVFGKFGTVWVKLKRDKRHMPFAFVQYTESAHAETALLHGKGADILGRPCRIEKCDGNLSYIIFRKNNRLVQYDEARIIFQKYGKVAKIETLDHRIRRRLNVPPSLLVHYEMFDSKRDVVKALGTASPFIIMPYDPKIVQDSSERAPSDATFMDLYDRDRRSAFFGSLPPHADEQFVRMMASTCGEVLSVDLRSTPDDGAGFPHVYAFVEFVYPNTPDEAVRQYNGTDVDGFFLRVERKRTKKTEQRLRPLPLQPIPPLRPHRRVASRSNFANVPMPSSTSDEVEIQAHLQDVQRLYEHEKANPRQGPISPLRAAVIANHSLDEYTPDHSPQKFGSMLHSPRKFGNTVHFAPSPASALSPAGSSPTRFHQPVPVSNNRPPILSPSFAERMASMVNNMAISGYRKPPGRSVSYVFSPAAGNAADRCESAIKKGEEQAKDDAAKADSVKVNSDKGYAGKEDETKGSYTKEHRRAASMYIQSTEPLKPVSESSEDSESSESEDDSSWRNSSDSREEKEIRKRKKKTKHRLRRTHLSDENLRRNQLYQGHHNRAHRSEENLRSKRGSLSRENLKEFEKGDKSHKSPGLSNKSRKSDTTERLHGTQDMAGLSAQQPVYQQPVYEQPMHPQAAQTIPYSSMAPQYPPPPPSVYSGMPMHHPQAMPPPMAPPAAPGGFSYMNPYPPPQTQYHPPQPMQYQGPPQYQGQPQQVQYQNSYGNPMYPNYHAAQSPTQRQQQRELEEYRLLRQDVEFRRWCESRGYDLS
ncbi:hypothetical protein F66182_5637 [Fusarium sp. NRRL 66182]|nr:hypothetical protein F66182_5637 [Fusarium sp. NRRL 66182]